MSIDLVRFWLPNRYSRLSGMYEVLREALGVTKEEFDARRPHTVHNDDGFWIQCRPDQFARFMIYRADLLEHRYSRQSVANGFTDLRVRLFVLERGTSDLEVWDRPHDG